MLFFYIIFEKNLRDSNNNIIFVSRKGTNNNLTNADER